MMAPPTHLCAPPPPRPTNGRRETTLSDSVRFIVISIKVRGVHRSPHLSCECELCAVRPVPSCETGVVCVETHGHRHSATTFLLPIQRGRGTQSRPSDWRRARVLVGGGEHGAGVGGLDGVLLVVGS